MFISFLWIQWSGKWTQARILQDKYNFKIFETWAIIRKMAEEDSVLGKKIKELIEWWNMIPTDLIKEILETYMKDIWKNHNVIFDWIPRNQEQKEIFEKYVKDVLVVYLELSKDEAIDRILSRSMCTNCNKTFPQDHSKETCASCGWKIIKRKDDSNTEAIEKRINIFLQETMPVVYEYKGKWTLYKIDANWTLEDVSKQIAEKLNLKI